MQPRIYKGKRQRRANFAMTMALTLAGSIQVPAHATDLVGSITTIAGEGPAGFSGDGGPALAARLRTPMGLTLDARGNLYVADQYNHRIRKINPDGTITTVAGTDKPGFSGDGGPAVEARLNKPMDVKADRYGNLYIAEMVNHRVRKIDTRGVITTVAGNGRMSSFGDGGRATQAGLNTPVSLAIDASDNLYIADEFGGRVRKVDSDGVITTVAGGGRSRKDGILATEASLAPSFVAIDGAANLWITECRPARFFRVDPRGILTTIVGGNGDGFAGDGGPVASARIDLPWFFAIDSAGSVFFSDTRNLRVRKIDRDGVITTVAGNGKRDHLGDGEPATAVSFYAPTGLVIDGEGNLFVADTTNSSPASVNPSYNRIRKITGVAAPGLLANRPFPTATLGDLDGDGWVSVRDATLTLRLVMGLLPETASRKAAGDYNGDEGLDMKDITFILRRAIGL